MACNVQEVPSRPLVHTVHSSLLCCDQQGTDLPGTDLFDIVVPHLSGT